MLWSMTYIHILVFYDKFAPLIRVVFYVSIGQVELHETAIIASRQLQL